MDCLNYFAPAVQALAALVIVGLTGALVYLTKQYVRVSEALQKPCVTVRSEPRDGEDAILDAPFIAQASQQAGYVVIKNIGTGPALNVRFGFRQTDAASGAVAMHPTGFTDYLQSGEERRVTSLARTSLNTRNFDFEANYESLSGKKHTTRIVIEQGIIKSLVYT